MSKEIYISSTPHETRLAIVENDALTEIYYERENEYTLAGSIYNGKVTRVLPGMQSSFVDIGLERDAFLYITDFMEEAPDSAEFDTSSLGEGGGRVSQAPRVEAQGTSAPGVDLRAEASPPRENSRDGREGRGGRRGRGDRGDRGTLAERPSAPLPAPAEKTFVAEPSRPAIPVSTESASELGEGAPGADGSRRWRGRRGRRRGRGPVIGGAAAPQDESAQTTDAGMEQPHATSPFSLDSAENATEGSFTEEHGENTSSGNIVQREPSEAFVEPAAEASEASEGSYNASRRDARNERGRDRGRDSGRDRTSGGRNDRGPRAPRGFAPSRSLYGVESAIEESGSEAPTEPIILPGESLSKYRAGASTGATLEASTSSSGLTPLPPSTVYTLAAGWDGGTTLPGESLSRHRGRESAAVAAPVTRTAPMQSAQSQPVPQPSNVSAEVTQVEVLHEPDGVSVAEVPESQPEIAEAAHPEHVTEPEILHEESSPAPEYEPVDASASYRVDPIPPVGYRQSAIEEPEIEQKLDAQEPVQNHDDADVEGTFGRTHFLTPEPSGPSASILPETSEMDTAEPRPLQEPAYEANKIVLAPETIIAIEPITGTPLPGHDTTILQESGEMISIAPLAHENEQAGSPAPQEEPEPTSPIHHENAILTPAIASADLVEEQNEEFEEAEEPASKLFAPGSGDLEEEVIDEDEYEVTALHAGYDDEMDDLEEETLDGAADLGTMLREMSIEQITRSSEPEAPLEEEEEDDEENFVEEFEDSGVEDGEQSEEYARTADATGDFSNEFREPEPRSESSQTNEASYNERRGGRRDLRRGGRDASRERDSRGGDSSGRPRNMGGSGDRERGRSGGGRGRMSMQSTNLPAISELLKPGQEILVQIAKEPIAKKGARITSHIALPGRFLVFMPTVNHTGVSRKIESDGERRRLKEILLSEKGEAAGGFIVRTAASGASEEELRSDLRFLLNLWTDIKQRSESSKSPALIYHDLNLVERILRDQVTDTFSAIWVDTETEYERVLRFLQRFQPSLIRRVKLYLKETPLFEQFGITEEINKALRSKVWLKSGGSIVINQTEALVAIDINTGKFVGKTARLEDTIVKTNLDAIPEIVRQIRLRDLGGIIIIDFIDMDERKNRNKVMAALEEELKSDRAPSKVLQFNDFGLVAITRKRVKQSLERTLSTTCNVCVGTGMVKSPVTVCNDIYIEMRKMYKHLDKGDVMLRVHPEVVKQLKSTGTRWLQEMEEMSGKTILVKSDPSLHPEQFDIH